MKNSVISIALLCLGVVFLMENYGLLLPSFWGNFFKFSPIILIILGLHIYFGKKFKAQVLLSLIFLISFFGLVFLNSKYSSQFSNILPINLHSLNFNSDPRSKRLQITKSQYSLDDINSIIYIINSKSNQLTLDDSLAEDYIEVKAYEYSEEKINLEPTLSEKKLTINISLPAFHGQQSVSSHSKIKTLNSNLNNSYFIDLGQGVVNMNLFKNHLIESEVKVGMGSIILDVSESTASGKINLNMDSGTVKLKLSKSQVINYDIGIGTVLRNGQRQDTGFGLRSNDSTDNNNLKIEVQIGFGSLMIEQQE